MSDSHYFLHPFKILDDHCLAWKRLLNSVRTGSVISKKKQFKALWLESLFWLNKWYQLPQICFPIESSKITQKLRWQIITVCSMHMCLNISSTFHFDLNNYCNKKYSFSRKEYLFHHGNWFSDSFCAISN